MQVTNRFIYIFLISCFFSLANAQSTDSLEEKRKVYDQLSQVITDQEEKQKYNGTDEIIRERLNLPPKLPTFEEWLRQREAATAEAEQQKREVAATAEAEQQKREVAATAEAEQQKREVAVEAEQQRPASMGTQISADLTKNVISESTPTIPTYALSDKEKYVKYSIISLLTAINFILYALFQPIRKITIAPPFDLGVRGIKTDSENNVKGKRYFVELSLLLTAGAFLFLTHANGKIYQEEDLLRTAIDSSISFGYIYLSYLICRLFFGYSSKCPKCNTPFAAKRTNKYKEPKSTYQSKITHNNTKNQVNTYETGIEVSNYICRNCAHSWTKTKNYKEQISTHHE